MKHRRTSLRASLEHLSRDFVDGVLHALRSASFAEMGSLRDRPALDRPTAGPVLRPSGPPVGLLAKLSLREREVFDRVLHGASNDDIARDLGLSIKTVQTHRAKVNRKLGVRSGSALVRFGAMHGLLQPQGDRAVPSAVSDLGAENTPAPAPIFDLAAVERRTIAAALRAAGGNRNQAAVLLGISRSKLDTKLLDLSKPAKGPSSVRAVVRPQTPSPSPPLPHHRDRPRRSAPRSRGSVRGAVLHVGRAQLAPPGEPLLDAGPARSNTESAAAITDPGALLGILEPRRLREAATKAPAAVTPPPPRPRSRPAARGGEDILESAGGGLVLRRRRAPTPGDRS